MPKGQAATDYNTLKADVDSNPSYTVSSWLGSWVNNVRSLSITVSRTGSFAVEDVAIGTYLLFHPALGATDTKLFQSTISEYGISSGFQPAAAMHFNNVLAIGYDANSADEYIIELKRLGKLKDEWVWSLTDAELSGSASGRKDRLREIIGDDDTPGSLKASLEALVQGD